MARLSSLNILKKFARVENEIPSATIRLSMSEEGTVLTLLDDGIDTITIRRGTKRELSEYYILYKFPRCAIQDMHLEELRGDFSNMSTYLNNFMEESLASIGTSVIEFNTTRELTKQQLALLSLYLSRELKCPVLIPSIRLDTSNVAISPSLTTFNDEVVYEKILKKC